jgi:3-hydroxyisobutyrate dehydrogenase-like beta-hydroxyacid dehydrogenase
MADQVAARNGACGVAMLGVGSMGSALAKALGNSGHHVSVWNRNRDSATALEPLCTATETVADACRSAELILTCFSNFDVTRDILKQSGVVESLVGKTLVQMSTATPDQVKILQEFCQSNGINFLDGKIAVTPRQIGGVMSVIFFAGPQALYDRYEPVFQALAGRSTYMGERTDAAVLGDFAFLSLYFAGTIGVLHGAAFARASGLSVEQFFSLVPSFLREIEARAESFKRMMLMEDYSDVQSALKTDLTAANLLANAVEQSGMSPVFSQSLIKLMQASVGQGLGELDSAAMVRTFANRL